MSIRTPPSTALIANLETVEFGRLLDREPDELQKLLALCVKDGFFYLNLENPRIIQLLSDKDCVVRMMEEFFALPTDEKMKDDRGSHTHGYKAAGSFTGFKEGAKDGYETLKVSYEEITSKSSLLPSYVKEQIELFDRFIGLCHLVNKTLLACLSDSIGLQPGFRFEDHHRDDQPSNTTLVLLHYPKQDYEAGMGHNKHTDIGSITLLFTEQWGLQLQVPEATEWSYVAPRNGHAIINVGDSLRFLSGKKFNSCLHRVIPVANDEDRYSIAYFLRPENGVQYKDTDGKEVTAQRWHDDKYVMFGEPHQKQAMSAMLTGGMERYQLRVRHEGLLEKLY